jgi:hypothetical protein
MNGNGMVIGTESRDLTAPPDAFFLHHLDTLKGQQMGHTFNLKYGNQKDYRAENKPYLFTIIKRFQNGKTNLHST